MERWKVHRIEISIYVKVFEHIIVIIKSCNLWKFVFSFRAIWYLYHIFLHLESYSHREINRDRSLHNLYIFTRLHKLSCKRIFPDFDVRLASSKWRKILICLKFYDAVNKLNAHKKKVRELGKNQWKCVWLCVKVVASLRLWYHCWRTLGVNYMQLCLSSCQSLPLCLATNTWSKGLPPSLPPPIHTPTHLSSLIASPSFLPRVSCPLTLAKSSSTSSFIVRQGVAKLLSLKLKIPAADVWHATQPGVSFPTHFPHPAPSFQHCPTLEFVSPPSWLRQPLNQRHLKMLRPRARKSWALNSRWLAKVWSQVHQGKKYY